MFTDRFLAFIPLLLALETSFNRDGSVHTERDPDDPGGTTKFGIDQRSHPHVDIAALAEDDAKAIYFSEWSRIGTELLPPRLAELLFDIHVNGGPGAYWLQQVLAVPADGFIGPVTRTAACALDTAQVNDACVRICSRRDGRFRRLSGMGAGKYLNGWLNRSARLRAFCVAPLDDDSSWTEWTTQALA